MENTTSLLQSAKDSIEQLALPILIMPNLRLATKYNFVKVQNLLVKKPVLKTRELGNVRFHKVLTSLIDVLGLFVYQMKQR